MKRRHKRIIINLFAFSALAFAIYLSYFHKDPPDRIPGMVHMMKH